MAANGVWRSVYLPLNADHAETRFLLLECSGHLPDHYSHELPITCTLMSAPLFYAPEYAALSYTWGAGKSAMKDIILNGMEVPVSLNLWSALQELRRRGESCVWIDALCINQADHEEKGDQIGRMGEIYLRAHKVVAWLGTASEDSSAAMRYLTVIDIDSERVMGQFMVTAKRWRTDTLRGSKSPWSPREAETLPALEPTFNNIRISLLVWLNDQQVLWSEDRKDWLRRMVAIGEDNKLAPFRAFRHEPKMTKTEQAVMDQFLHSEALMHRTIHAWYSLGRLLEPALNSLFRRPYFYRVWILQEIAKGNAVELWCGEDTVLLDRVPEEAGIFGELESLQLVKRFRRLEQKSRQSEQTPRMLLMDALTQSRHLLATERIDKVYALLGLTRDGRDIVPFLSYSQESKHVYIAIAKKLIIDRGYTDLMLLAPRCVDASSRPSWCPALDSQRLPPWLALEKNSTRDTMEFKFRTDGPEAIVVQGTMFDLISSVAGHELQHANEDFHRSVAAHPELSGEAKPPLDPQGWGVWLRRRLGYHMQSKLWLCDDARWRTVLLTCFYLSLDHDTERLETILPDADEVFERHAPAFTDDIAELCAGLAKTMLHGRTILEWVSDIPAVAPEPRHQKRGFMSNLPAFLRGKASRTAEGSRNPATANSGPVPIASSSSRHKPDFHGDLSRVVSTMQVCAEHDMRLAFSASGWCGMVYKNARPGDIVTSLLNCHNTAILRPRFAEPRRYSLVGEAHAWERRNLAWRSDPSDLDYDKATVYHPGFLSLSTDFRLV